MFEAGIPSYKSGIITIPMHLPAERPVCKYCWMCGYDSGMERAFCRATQEYIIEPSKERGARCPIVWEGASD